MRKLILFSVLAAILAGCGAGEKGQLIGVQGRKPWYQPDPYGMLYIPMGSFNMGPSDQDVPYAHVARSKTVSLPAFYMDQTEITNNEYRQFVNWVVDSIARRKLVDLDEEVWAITTDQYGEDLEEPYPLNWDERLRWDSEDEDVREELNSMYYPEYERFYGRKEIDTRKLVYEYFWIDMKAAASWGSQSNDYRDGRDLDLSHTNIKGQSNAIRGHSDRSKFIIEEKINVYPDTLVWINDFTYSFNEPQTNMYFWHPAYDEYPVVGVTWTQAKAFNVWRTQLFNNFLKTQGSAFVQDFRLPSEAEWEYAARGGIDLSPYPWGGPYIRNRKGCFLGNFKPLRGNYVDDGGFYTVKVYSYSPNDFGLYCMAGNVAEWTNTAYDESVYEFSHDLSTEYTYDALKDDPPSLKRKVISGGSWKDIGFYLQAGTRTYEYQDTAKSYVGFRSVMSYLGRAKGDDI